MQGSQACPDCSLIIPFININENLVSSLLAGSMTQLI
jgi:hypothetical protein